jgi:hypothetical protein
MEKFPQKFVLSKRPQEYLKQGLSHCHMYCIKGILSAYGKDIKKNPEDYHSSRVKRILGVIWNPDILVMILSKYGVAAQAKTAKNLSAEERLVLLKRLLANDTPVMIRIANGYLPSGKYSTILGKMVGHWITLWGYNDGEKVFYVYDSAIPQKRYDKGIPIGNKRRTYFEISRDWKGPLTPWLLTKYLYIETKRID